MLTRRLKISTHAVSGGASTAVVGLYLVKTAVQQNGKGAVETVHTPSFATSTIWLREARTQAFVFVLRRHARRLEHWRFWQVIMADFFHVSRILEAERALEP